MAPYPATAAPARHAEPTPTVVPAHAPAAVPPTAAYRAWREEPARPAARRATRAARPAEDEREEARRALQRSMDTRQ